MSSRDPPWMSPLVKSLLKKKPRSRKGGGRDLAELTEKIGRLIAENRRALASGKLGSLAWWRKVDRLSMRRDKSRCEPDKDFIICLDDYFGDICFDREYSEPVPAEIDANTPAPQLSTFQVFIALTRRKRTATGPDGIPFWIWKDYAEIFTPVIENLLNMSLARQIWPSRWKEANINPLPKVETPVEYADFRGNNVIPVIARTFERTVYNIFNKRRLEQHLNHSQFAYRSEIDGYRDIFLFKYADDSTVLVTITKDSPDISDIALSKFMDWTVANGMHCNTTCLYSVSHLLKVLPVLLIMK
ncbi:hypothetical protein AWC38_SpisGene23110 [Stylophora pistillata]|uniref:Reverse transcriptase domain-containing protein n=1 Tax=Stylophora pistillata TaxID=50429 RepID=A0A2B4R9F4_STYPI|nr:hypothetical protein AWC38_SpisGene23110 [Stylophora pistillata]